MKKLVLFFLASILFTSIGYAQHRNGLTGPKAKNYKHWQDNSDKSTLVYKVSKKQLTGPKAKNKHLLKDQEDVQYANVSTSSQPRLTGPKAKNQKLWDSADQDKIDTAKDEPVREEKKTRSREVGNDNR